jgi:septal ring factor EnvC (AmiA/AmiB activator)
LDSDIPRLDAEAQHAQTTMQQLRQELAVQAVELDRLRTSETRLRAAVVAAQAPAPEEPREVAALDRAVRLPDPPEPAREAAVAARPGGAATTAAQAPEAGGARAGETEERPGLLARLFGLGRRERVEEAPPTAETPTPAPRPDANEAFEKRRGALRAPASGRILARFGDRHTTGAVYKAVVVRTVPAASVRAVASGEVVYSGSFPGIGNTVIVAHGGRYHTVYGRLGSIRRDVGARVAEGDVVGTMGPADTDLHFEVRSEGRSVDPLPWLGGGAGAFGG